MYAPRLRCRQAFQRRERLVKLPVGITIDLSIVLNRAL
jgi:hypothetical protein